MDQLDSKAQDVLYTVFEWPHLPKSRLCLVGKSCTKTTTRSPYRLERAYVKTLRRDGVRGLTKDAGGRCCRGAFLREPETETEKETQRQRRRPRDREGDPETEKETQRQRKGPRDKTEKRRHTERDRERDPETDTQRETQRERKTSRNRGRHTERETETQRQGDTHTERQTERDTEKETQRQRGTHRERETETQRQRGTHRERDPETEGDTQRMRKRPRDRGRHTEKETDRDPETERDIERETEKETQRQRGTHTHTQRERDTDRERETEGDTHGERETMTIDYWIANALDLTDRILPRLQARPRCRPQLLHFPPYSRQELSAIVQDRLSQASAEGLLDPSAVQFCARKVSAVSGDARKALDICRRAVEVVESDERKKTSDPDTESKGGVRAASRVSLPQVARVLSEVYGDRMASQGGGSDGESFPLQQKLLVCCLLLLTRSGKSREVVLGKIEEQDVENALKDRTLLGSILAAGLPS
ncbi:hypothetical protein FQN60_018579 [Etheostoma spectabile]|uniref:Cdc6/ORC1-like ATPase lid domain-containing protein n=1 Tax=Etheostoma spectabile TaxID=54343 RepID=A0A5J5DIB9_9PERO|nr:hypothetical protein FQN60_018579 [Etheostoma spectabile]